MTQKTANLTTATIASLNTPTTEQPAGGWGSWMQPLQLPAPTNPITPGATIYTLSIAEIQNLRSSGLITDETSLFYQLRIKNTALKSQQSSDVYSFQLTSSRTFRAIAVLMRYGFISQFSIDTLNLSWIKIIAAMSDAEIRSNWQKKISDDLEYTYEVLNLQRGNSTTSTANPTTLYSGYSITYLMLGDCLNHLSTAKNNVVSPYIGNISVTWQTPILGAGISAEELRSLYKLGLIGDAFYVYCAMRAVKVAATQAIDSSFFLENWSIPPNKLLDVIWRLRSRNIITSAPVQGLTIAWNITPPPYSWYQVKNMSAALDNPGELLFAIAALSPANYFNLQDIRIKSSIKIKVKDDELGLLMSSINNELITAVSVDSFTVTWAS